jgi:hypothetical protein
MMASALLAGLSPVNCGAFFNDWERIQHLVNQRHSYQAWTPENGARAAEKNGRAPGGPLPHE